MGLRIATENLRTAGCAVGLELRTSKIQGTSANCSTKMLKKWLKVPFVLYLHEFAVF
jgi:hypothetical protein